MSARKYLEEQTGKPTTEEGYKLMAEGMDYAGEAANDSFFRHVGGATHSEFDIRMKKAHGRVISLLDASIDVRDCDGSEVLRALLDQRAQTPL